MRIIKSFSCLLLMILSYGNVMAQDPEDYEYTDEFVWGINKNTRGGLIGGFIFKKSIRLSENQFQTFGLELMNVKHPKETRISNPLNGNSFIWGKQNYLYSVRLQYGREVILFKKASFQGLQIHGILAGGPTLGIVSPYYIQNSRGINEPYDPEVHVDFNSILGTGNILQGLGDSEVKFGLNLKPAFSFEFGTFKSNVSGIELGFVIEAFTEDIVLVPNDSNDSLFTSFFVTLFYGRRR
ncbi:MAG: hypothetical protein OER04_03830 [Cyclobacteriaceae bacterium]|nr:hypothetical protein [Cyclobacteriaceae bacterium]